MKLNLQSMLNAAVHTLVAHAVGQHRVSHKSEYLEGVAAGRCAVAKDMVGHFLWLAKKTGEARHNRAKNEVRKSVRGWLEYYKQNGVLKGGAR